MSPVLRPASFDDDRAGARARLPHQLFEYLDNAAGAEITAGENVAAFRRLRLRQKVLVDVSGIDTRTTLFGQTLAMPVALGPVGFSGLFARRGEVQAARAARAAGVPFTLSTVGICTLAEVAAGAGTPPWYQLYVIRDRGFAAEMIARARAASVPALVLTVDLPVVGARWRETRAGMGGGLSPWGRLRVAADYTTRWRWLWDVGLMGRPHRFGNLAGATAGSRAALADLKRWIDGQFDPSFTFDDLAWLRGLWDGPLIIKGIMDAGDAARAIAACAPEALVVSNHGGRQLDGVPASLDALPAVRDAVAGRAAVLMDGGIRSGLDVAKALARGADGVLLGRAWAMALAARGEAGVAAMLQRMASDLRVAMALTGARRVSDLRGVLIDPPA